MAKTRTDRDSVTKCVWRVGTNSTVFSQTLPPSKMSQSACVISPVKAEYQPKGISGKVAGLDAYVVGPDSKHVLLSVYDIFGFWDTTKQSADLLSEALRVKVIMPDFFRGKPWPMNAFPPRDEEEQKVFDEWFATVASVSDRKKDLDAIAQELKSQGVEKIGVYGFSWGAKIASLAGYEGTPFTGVVIVYPAMMHGGGEKQVVPESIMVSGEDSKYLGVPAAFFPSKDEPRDESDKYWSTLKQSRPELVEKSVYHYYDIFHGFAAAPANFHDEANRAAATELYQRLANFFHTIFQSSP